MVLLCLAHHAWGAGGAVEVRRLGLSKVAENTLLTVVLDRAATPRVSARNVAGKPQLVVDFPGARAGQLPTHLEGDESLVQQVLTETASPGAGCASSWTSSRRSPTPSGSRAGPAPAGQFLFILGLKPDTKARPVQARVVPPSEPARRPHCAAGEEIPGERDGPRASSDPRTKKAATRSPKANVAPGSFAELRSLMPKAAPLLQGLETEGWAVSESHRYDRPGKRFSRDFILTNNRYPELAVKIVYLPANVPNTPNIDIIMLTTENLAERGRHPIPGSAPVEFRQDQAEI